MKSIKKTISKIISFFGAFLSLIIPKNKKLIIFTGSDMGFNENSRYLFNYFYNHDYFRIVWLTTSPQLLSEAVNKDFRFFHPGTLNGLITCLRAKFIIGTGVSPLNYLGLMTFNTIKLNLWHGIGPRSNNAGRELDDRNAKYRGLITPYEIIKLINKWDFVNFPSKQMSTVVGKLQYLLPKKKRIVLGYPRCDHLFDDRLIRQALKEKEYIGKLLPNVNLENDFILYAPTWRMNNDSSIPLLDLIFDRILDFNQILNDEDKYLLVSKHPLAKNSIDLKGISNIIYVPNNDLFNMNDLLPEITSLITDYSSIATDFLIMDRPTAYYMPDYDNYLYNIGLLDDLRSNLPGFEIIDHKDLVNFIKNPEIESIEIKNNIDNYLKRYYDTSLHNSSKELYKFIVNINK